MGYNLDTQSKHSNFADVVIKSVIKYFYLNTRIKIFYNF